MSLLQVMRIFAPNLWGWLADHSGRGVHLVQAAAGLSLLTYLGVFAGESFAWLFIVMATMSFFWSASLPLMESITLRHLGDGASRYGRIRLWGSIGFVASVVSVGYLLDFLPIRALLWAVLILMIGVFLLSRWIPEPHPQLHHEPTDPISDIVRRPEVAVFLAAGFLMAAAHGVYYTFYSIYMVDHGYSKGAIGWLWSIGVLCEILVFLWMPRLVAVFGLRKILLASFLLATLRFSLIGFGASWPMVVVIAQILHAASFGSYHAASVAVINQFFRGQHHAKGQAIYTSISFGLGGTVGGLWSGWLWEPAGPEITFAISSIATLIAFILLFWRLKLQP